MADDEIISDGGCRRHWSSPEKLRIVEETLADEILKEALAMSRSRN